MWKRIFAQPFHYFKMNAKYHSHVDLVTEEDHFASGRGNLERVESLVSPLY